MSTIVGTAKASLQRPFIVIAITLLMCASVLVIYLHGPLQGNFSHFFMPAEKFGVPSELRAHGITEQYKGTLETGWDGQFYYYIANDPLAQKDTIQHIDSDAYRYQRIGLPLLANLAAKITGQSWVSPLTYYLTSLFIILAAVGTAALFFQQKKLSPYLILLWSLACGTQVTQLHGLPDAAADSLLIIALVSLVNKRLLWYVFAITFAALSREIYILFPVFMIIILVAQHIQEKGVRWCLKSTSISHLFKVTWIHSVPVLIMLGWQIFIRIKFDVSPSSQAHNILNWPLVSAFHYMIAGLKGNHPVVGTGRMAYLEGAGVGLFLLLLIISAINLSTTLCKVIHSSKITGSERQVFLGTAFTFITIIFLYLCFGSIVMMHHTGYFKAANIFLFVLPFIACLTERKINSFMILFLGFLTLYFDYFLWGRITAPPYQPTPPIHYAVTAPTCLKNYQASITPLSIETPPTDNLIRKFLIPRTFIINVKIVNRSNQPFSPFPGKGGTNMSYQWVKINNSAVVVLDGVRTSLITTLAPDHSTILPVHLYFPRVPGQYLLKLSLVQEGCTWFYLADPHSTFTIPYTVN